MSVRKITVSGTVSAVDDENGSDQHGNAPVSGVALVSPGVPADVVEMSLKVGGEVRVELTLYARIADNNAVQINGSAKLFEGTSDDTGDLEDEEAIDLQIAPDIQTDHTIHLVNSGFGGGDTADITLTFTNVEGPPRRNMPPTVEAADQERAIRGQNVLRAWARNFRDKHNRALLPWQGATEDDDDGTKTLRHIAAGMAIFAHETRVFGAEDWACFSGEPETKGKEEHRKAFVKKVEAYFAEQVTPYMEIGTALKEKRGPYKDNGDYDFRLRDIIALIYIFFDKPQVLTNTMIRNLICQGEVTFTPSGDSYTVTGSVPFAGQNLDEWLAAGKGGRPFFEEEIAGDDIVVKISTPETENHLLLTYVWRFLVNEYLTYVHLLSPENDPHKRFDPQLRALVASDPERYTNGTAIYDWVLQLLGRVTHAGMYESNAKPYGAYSIAAMLAFYHAADRLVLTDPEWQKNAPQRQKIKTAAQNALDYLAAEFAFQSFEGKRMAPFRRNAEKEAYVSFYGSDYAPHIFGVLTGAYVFSDGEDGPFGPLHVGQEAGFALWAILSGYRVPHAIHDFMLNKHGGYFARIQTRYATDSYPLNYKLVPPQSTPDFARPRYFQAVSSGEVSSESYDIVGPGGFRPVTQLYFATPTYLNSAGGHPNAYYEAIKLSLAEVAALVAAGAWVLTLLSPALGFTLGLPAAILLPLIRDKLNDFLYEKTKKIRGSDVKSRPSVLITRGNLQVSGDTDIASLERMLPTMRGQDDYWASQNLTTYKSFSLGYTFKPGEERHQDWPQRYPGSWDGFLVERFGIGRAAFLVFDFTAQPEHPLAGHYWVVAKFSKRENKGQFRNYGRGFWEVVPGHQFANAAALRAHIEATNPAAHFDNDEDHDYKYRLATTGERVTIHNRFGSSATSQAILEIQAANGDVIPLNRYTANMGDEAGLRQLPLMDVWQVDRDYNFTGMKYAYADGRGRVMIHNPFLGETLTLDSSDYRAPSRTLDKRGLITGTLPPIDGTDGQIPGVAALLLDQEVIYATHYFAPELFQPSTQPGELVALDRHTLQPIKRVTVGKSPRAIGLHQASNRLYIVNYQDISVTVVDAETFTVLKTMTFPGFGLIAVAVSQKYNRIFVSQPGQKRIIVLDGETLTEVASMTDLPMVSEVVVDEAIDRLYALMRNVVDQTRQDLVEFAINEQGQQELRRTTIDGQVSVFSEMAVDAKRIYVINKDPQIAGDKEHQQLTVLDRQSLTVVGKVPLESRAGLGVTTCLSQHIIYVTTQYHILVIDVHSLQVLRTILLTEYQSVAYQPQGAVVVDPHTGTAYFGGAGSSHLVRYGVPPIDLGQ